MRKVLCLALLSDGHPRAHSSNKTSAGLIKKLQRTSISEIRCKIISKTENERRTIVRRTYK